MAALLKRWCGDMQLSSAQKAAKPKPKKRPAPVPPQTKKKKASKRSRGTRGSKQDADEGSDFEPDEEPEETAPTSSSKSTSTAAGETDFSIGSKIVLAIAEILPTSDYSNFSGDASEQINDIIATALACASCIQSLDQGSSECQTAQSFVTSVTASLSDSLTNPSTSLARRHQNAIYILRGITPLISLTLDVPGGVKGKLSAYQGASALMNALVNKATEFDFVANMARDEEMYKEHLKSMMSNMAGADNMESVKPPLTFDLDSNDPRPVLSAFVGMLQKVSCSSLEKAEARSRTSTLLKSITSSLPANESAHFLKFIIKLSKSNKANHRLFATEFLGQLLLEDWMWSTHLESGAVEDVLMQDVSDDEFANDDDASYTSSTGAANSKPKPKLAPLDVSTSVIIEGIGERDPNLCIPLMLINGLIGRLSDRAPGVRARAAQSVADSLQAVLNNPSEEGAVYWLGKAATSLSHSLVSGLRKRVTFDDRAAVRKAAVVGLATTLVLAPPPSQEDIDVLEERCGDPSVATRKASAEGLTNLVVNSLTDNEALEVAWARSVLPLVVDGELACVTKALQLFKTTIIVPLSQGEEHELFRTSLRILTKVAEESKNAGAAKAASGSLKMALKRVLDEESDKFIKSLVKNLKKCATHSLGLELDTSEDSDSNNLDLYLEDVSSMRCGVWCILEGLAGCSHKGTSNTGGAKKGQSDAAFDLSKVVKRSKLDGTFLTNAWEKFQTMLKEEGLSDEARGGLSRATRSCLKVTAKLAGLVPKVAAEATLRDMKEVLLSGRADSDVIGSCVVALTALTATVAETPKEAVKGCTIWIKELFKSCEGVLERFISNPRDAEIIEATSRALFLVGEVAIVGFHSDDDGGLKEERVFDEDDDRIEWVRGMKVAPTSKLVSLVQVLLPPKMVAVDKGEEVFTPQGLRALAYLSLGKLCLRDAELAKSAVNLLAREIHYGYSVTNGDSAAVRSNALVVLGDMCIRYTNMVDRQLPAMAACLQDVGGPLVRRHAILLLSSLLLQDYVKWRGLLIMRFLAAVTDTDEAVSQMAEMTLCGPLLNKSPLLFSNSFVESLFVFNNFTGHPVYTAAASSGDSGSGAVDFQGVNLAGPANAGKRMFIYKMMLAHMSDEQRIGVTARLAKEVLKGGMDGKLKEGTLGGETVMSSGIAARAVLADCFDVLVCPEIRVGRAAAAEQADADADDERNAGRMTTEGPIVAQLAAAKGKLLTKVSKRHMMENVVPILTALKVILEKNKSPLLKKLMVFLRELFSNYKKELKEVLASTPTILNELEYDIKKFAIQQKAKKEKQAKMKLAGIQRMLSDKTNHMGGNKKIKEGKIVGTLGVAGAGASEVGAN